MTVMKTRVSFAVLLFVALSTRSLPAFAQVERVIIEADGMKDSCVPGLEAALKSLDSVYKYGISPEKQMFSIIYYAGEKFDARRIYWLADKGEAEVKRIHLAAHGKIHEEGGQQIFVAGENRFLITGPKKLPADVNIGIIGVVDDSSELMQLKPDDYQVFTDQTPPPDAPVKPPKSKL
jgi:hypothetical protein